MLSGNEIPANNHVKEIKLTKKETEPKKYSVAGVVRARLHQIEKLRSEGMTQEGIVDLLNKELKDFGFTTSVENFRNELYRARKRAKEAAAKEQKKREAAEAAGLSYHPPQVVAASQPELNQDRPAVLEKSSDQPQPKNSSGPYIPQRPRDMRKDTKNADTIEPEKLAKMLGTEKKPQE